MKGLSYSFKEFSQESEHSFLEKIKAHMVALGFDFEESQCRSWLDCFDFLKCYLPLQNYEDLSLIFEYFLPMEGGRRPDVIILTDGKVIVLEFKRKGKVALTDVHQAIHYREDLANYHSEINRLGLQVSSYLVYTAPIKHQVPIGIQVLTAEKFYDDYKSRIGGQTSLGDVRKWMASKYQPLPSMLNATKMLFENGALPQIKRIEEGEITHALTAIRQIIANPNASKSLIFVGGVPGSGKTLVGLKTVYDYLGKNYNPIYLSGNGPLVNVLQGLLSNTPIKREGRSIVRGMREFKSEYRDNNAIPNENILVFDEAQRAWTAAYNEGKSEATVFLEIAEKVYLNQGHVTIICLVGEGQLIHKGEGGLELWDEALMQFQGWKIYLPEKFSDQLPRQKSFVNDALYLDISIRHHFINVYPWIEAVLSSDLVNAKTEYNKLLEKGFSLLILRDEISVMAMREKIKLKFPDDHVGLFISSHILPWKEKEIFSNINYNGSFVQARDAYDWYMQEAYSFNKAASEFLAQGLESEWPFVVFGGDYYLHQGRWMVEKSIYRKKASDKAYNGQFLQVMENIYRVLLSRSRKGMFLYIPKNLPELEETYHFFKRWESMK